MDEGSRVFSTIEPVLPPIFRSYHDVEEALLELRMRIAVRASPSSARLAQAWESPRRSESLIVGDEKRPCFFHLYERALRVRGADTAA